MKTTLTTGAKAMGLFLMGASMAGKLWAQPQPSQDDAWQFRGGAALLTAPKALGGESRRVLVLPYLEARHPSGFFASSADGVGMAWAVDEAWRFSVAGALDWRQRRAKDDARLKGWQDVKSSPALSMSVQHSQGPTAFTVRWVTRLQREGEQRQAGASTVHLEAAHGLRLGDESSVQAGYALTLMNSRFAQTFFAVSEAQSRSTGLKRHQAGAGIMSNAVFLQWQTGRGDGWQVMARAELESLSGQAGSSPLVKRKLQPSVLLAVTRPF